ncbi:MAG TPA: Sir2 family NAD-dependent protein deacetylase [Pyrinomonadaceae bacterium]|jgi:NAD-dependent SIR2 family protein deacetylase
MVKAKSLQEQIETISRWIIESEHTVAFTGAGISTDSGIPDFRGPEGVWTRRDAGLPAPRWRVSPEQVGPNASHVALVELQRLGKLRFLITQNTDNLHRRSGIDPAILAELHGNGHLMRCLACDRLHERRAVGWDASKWGAGYRTQSPVAGQPACPACGGRLISSVVNFGDPLPEKELMLAAEHARRCDLMLVLGSSLVVNPAASLVGLALRNGARAVLVNQGETPYDEAVSLRVSAGIGDVIPPAAALVRQHLSGDASLKDDSNKQ